MGRGHVGRDLDRPSGARPFVHQYATKFKGERFAEQRPAGRDRCCRLSCHRGYGKRSGIHASNFTIGPRIGLNYIATQINDYREHGQTGLELRYSGQDTSSLQSSLGAVATAAMSTQFGVLLPQVSASWVHDYAVGGRNVDASFVDATGPSKFSFEREEQAPNYAIIGVGVSALLPNKLQPFVNFKTIQGNEYLVSYGGTAGLRVGL